MASLTAELSRITGYSTSLNATPPRNDSPPTKLGPEIQPHPTPPLLLSFVLHLVLLFLIAWVASSAPKGSQGEIDRQIGIAVVHRLPDRDQYEEVTADPKETVQDTAADSSSAAAAAAPPADLSPPIDLQGILSAMQSTPAPVSGSGIAGDVKLAGDAFGDGAGTAAPSSGQQATAKLFGVSGSGTRFVYVFDRSDSMNGFGGLPLRSAKRELIRSLQSLSPQQQFQIIFYNENVKPFQMSGMPMTMVAGEPNNLKRAQRYVEAIQAFGGTKHKGALLMALRLSPDVIFFLTDAHIPRLSQLELKLVQDRAEQSGTTIHAIEFGSRGGPAADSFLKDLAAMNNGQYQYVDVRQLRSEPVQPNAAEPGADEAPAP
ncbi:hypothetical protein Enr13x_72850 [Stieleria neptunia]|uniref:VWFA domain-containing protein n=1 Tax=Stieleria neptunia TaxID=2527979 RepID=A0A518I2T6_9BACT|nr:hypothetical protein [Stieleria neptunia]QDV47376.1 hypothetical protein Enr13x_72850 [Stieleria neptunia]